MSEWMSEWFDKMTEKTIISSFCVLGSLVFSRKGEQHLQMQRCMKKHDKLTELLVQKVCLEEGARKWGGKLDGDQFVTCVKFNIKMSVVHSGKNR